MNSLVNDTKEFPLDVTSIRIGDLADMGLYDESLLLDLKENKLMRLEELNEAQRNNRDFMEPILYSVYNEFKTFEVYKYMGYDLKAFLQSDSKLSTDILLNEPELIENSPLSENRELILKNKDANPDIIKYISPSLENDQAFLVELSTSSNPEVIKEAIDKYSVQTLVASNRNLAKNEEFMKAALSKDISSIVYADEKILNSYDVFKEASVNNEKVIDYAIENNESLGNNAIDAVRDTAKENADNDYMQVVEENASKDVDKRFKKVKAKIEEKGEDNPAKMRWITAMAAKADKVEPALIKEALDYVSLSKIKLERADVNNEDYQITTDDYMQLVSPTILSRLIEKADIKELDPQMQQRLSEYTEFYQGFTERFNQQKKAKLQDRNSKNNKEELSDLQKAITGYESREAYEAAKSDAKESHLRSRDMIANSIER